MLDEAARDFEPGLAVNDVDAAGTREGEEGKRRGPEAKDYGDLPRQFGHSTIPSRGHVGQDTRAEPQG